MKKRIYWLVVLGVFIAPSALAKAPEIMAPGELKVSQHDGRSIECSAERKILPTDIVRMASGGESRAGVIK